MRAKNTILTLAVSMTGLNAGLLYAYEVSVIPAFTTISDKDYVASMQAINVAIQNAVFVPLFLGAALFLAIAAFLERRAPRSLRFRLLVGATILYVFGTLGVTFAVNVPLNDTLAAVALQSSTPAQITAARTAFEAPWNTWHLIRTLAAIGAFVLATVACLAVSAAHPSQLKR